MADTQVDANKQPQVTVRNIPQSDYNANPASGAMGEPTEPGLKGHLKKYGMLYLIAIGAITILVIILFRNNSGAGAAGSTNGSDPYGYGTGNSSPSDLYGSQLDSDYQQMINQENQTNALLQQLLNQKTTTKPPKTGGGGGHKGGGGGGHHGGGGGGDHHHGGGGSGGRKHHGGGGHKTGSDTGGKTIGGHHKTKPGGNTGGSSGGHTTGSTKGGHTGHPPIMIMKPNPNYGGAHGWTYTAKGGENVQNLFDMAWPGKPSSFGFNYADNARLLRGMRSNILNKGQQVEL